MAQPANVRVLALCGSLRATSINAALLRAAARLAPPGMSVQLAASLGNLPLFNADLEASPPEAVMAFHDAIANCDALLIASPEYAHGVTGTIKNALDWLVGYEPFAFKSIAVFNASPRATHADAALRETLQAMAAQVVIPASIALPLLGSRLDEDGIVATPQLAGPIRVALLALQEAAANRVEVAADNSPWWA
jgi:NAD(P)H-dependent FMN reductase